MISNPFILPIVALGILSINADSFQNHLQLQEFLQAEQSTSTAGYKMSSAPDPTAAISTLARLELSSHFRQQYHKAENQKKCCTKWKCSSLIIPSGTTKYIPLTTQAEPAIYNFLKPGNRCKTLLLRVVTFFSIQNLGKFVVYLTHAACHSWHQPHFKCSTVGKGMDGGVKSFRVLINM